MPINKNSLQSKINNLSKATGVHQNILLKSFFFDAFLKRLSKSQYVENFVFKGGFLLSMNLGINLRSTQDIDFLVNRIDLDKNNIAVVINNILSTAIDDGISFSLETIEQIRIDDEYGGFSVKIIGRLENIKETVNIDIATGDPITPNSIDYKYKCLFDDEILSFQAYNFETILSEKLQTILSKAILNSRSKDFYDLFIIHKLRWADLNLKTLKMAFINTCMHRKTIFDKDTAMNILEKIKTDTQMNMRWNSYKKRNKFVGEISFDETVCIAEYIVETIFTNS